jgi:hypothetical protein
MSDDKGGKMGKYPKGAIRQHQRLATGAPLQKVNSKDLNPHGWGPGGMGKGGTISSSGDTGGPRGGKVPNSTMTPA